MELITEFQKHPPEAQIAIWAFDQATEVAELAVDAIEVKQVKNFRGEDRVTIFSDQEPASLEELEEEEEEEETEDE